MEGSYSRDVVKMVYLKNRGMEGDDKKGSGIGSPVGMEPQQPKSLPG